MQKTGILRLCSIVFFIFSFAFSGEAKVKLPVLVSDGMVLQRETPIVLWGWADANEQIEIVFKNKTYTTQAGEKGDWKITLPAQKAGGPYSMQINDIELQDILIGDVWLCSGQSNMETPLPRVMELYADEILTYSNTQIRHIKIPLSYNFHAPQQDIESAEWKAITTENISLLTAVPYFFAKFLYEEINVPIGLINSSVGGSPAEAWISEEYLKDFPHYLNDRQICESDSYVAETQKLQQLRNSLWSKTLNEGDKGLKEKWTGPALDDSDWETVNMFAGWGSDGVNPVNGSFWFRKNIELPAHLATKKATLRLGCIVDADSVFVNGVFVGATSYQYPPRIYQIPENLLKEGRNNITIRLISQGGFPHFVSGKPYKIIFDNEEINLEGDWKYKLGNRMLAMPGGITFHNKPAVLYNSMIAPLKNLALKGVLWYQGESNANRHNEYYALLSNLITNWRALWASSGLPFIIVQLPNYMPSYDYPTESWWADLRDVQLKLSQNIPYTGLSVNIDIGEWNDIHPLNKKDVGYRLMLQAQKLAYGNTAIVADGPVYESKVIDGDKIILSFREGTDDFMPVAELKGFAIAGEDSKYHWAEATIENRKVIVRSDKVSNPVKVRYAWADNPAGANLKNKSGLPASPFETK
jgi:sialate O-acetylesterase